MKKYFFDESGFTGNLKMENNKLNSNGNNIFVLTALELEEDSNLEEKIIALKEKYRIRATELKSKSILKRYNNFYEELIELLKKEKTNVIAEAINKEYFLIMQLCSYLLFNPLTKHLYKEINNKKSRIIYASILYEYLPKEILQNYYNIINNFSKCKFEEFLNEIIVFFKGIYTRNMMEAFKTKEYFSEKNKEIASLFCLLKDVEKFYFENENKNKNYYKYFLPIPDFQNEKCYNSYYHLNCFTNIILRINKKLKNEKIFLNHDIQLESKEILEKNFNEIKKLKFLEKNDFDLKFKDSKDELMIQIADLISSGIRKILSEEKLELKKETKENILKYFKVNLVLPQGELKKYLKKEIKL